MQSIKRTIQNHGSFVATIIKGYLKATTHSNQKLMTCFMGMSSPGLTAWNVIQIKNSLYFEWNVYIRLNHR